MVHFIAKMTQVQAIVKPKTETLAPVFHLVQSELYLRSGLKY